MKITKGTLHPFTALMIVFVLSMGCAEPPEPATALSVVTVEQSDALESAITRVRTFYFARDYDHGAAEGDLALERWPESSELAAWTIANLSRSSALWSSRAEYALARAELMVESRPDDVWAAIALAHALAHVRDHRDKAIEASLRALELAPTLPEAVWVRGILLHNHRQYHEVIVLIDEKWPMVDRQWPELLILKANAYLAIPDRVDEGLEILTQVRELDPKNVNAHLLAGNILTRNTARMSEGIALLERAAVLSPGSSEITAFHWHAISRYPGLNAEEKLTHIRSSASELLELRSQYPGMLVYAAQTLDFLMDQPGLEELKAEGEAIEDLLLANFADTEEAVRVLWKRWQTLSRDLMFGTVENTVTARAELTTMLWSFINRPHHYQTELLGDAYLNLFDQLLRNEFVSPDTLLLAGRGAVAHARRYPHAQVATGLAERGVYLDEARQLANDGLEALQGYIMRTPGAAGNLDQDLANAYSALGYVELKMGDLVTARDAIDRALALKPDDSRVQFQTGALAEAEGNIESAEIHYAWGEQIERLNPGDDKPNRGALQRIYTERHGAMTGFEEYIVGIMVRDRDRRRQRVADTRIAEPRKLPAIDLEWLDGGRIGADELKNRIVVINFWGTWCPPCIEEAPQIQQFHEKYRDDPDVVFLTINAFDPDLNKVRTWMADNDYNWPVLVDDNFVNPNNVQLFPTTWFAGRDGRIVFDYSTVSTGVFEEFVWRVEMLQAEGGS